MIVALGYQSRVGKDTLASYLAGELGCGQLRFASALKSAAHEAFVHYGLRAGHFYDTAEGAPLRTVPLPGVGKSPVELWVQTGEALKGVCPTVWLDRVMQSINPGSWWVISDLRFPAEAQAIRDAGGATVLVLGRNPVIHGSDRALDDWKWDYTVRNYGSLEDLRDSARVLARKLRERAKA